MVRPIVEISPGLRLDESNAGKLVEQDAGLSLEGMAGALHGQPIRLLVSHSAGCSQHFCRRGAGPRRARASFLPTLLPTESPCPRLRPALYGNLPPTWRALP